jgi:hypothetical protein
MITIKASVFGTVYKQKQIKQREIDEQILKSKNS